MEFQLWIYYFLAVLILTASPGPSVLLCMTTSITQGFKASIFAALGSLTAIIAIMTLSFTGLGVIVASSEFIFSLIKWSGAAYLIYLGYKAFTSTEYTYTRTNEYTVVQQVSLLSSYISGFIVGASNPKAILFFSALLPQFIDPQASLLSQYFILMLTFAVMELLWLLMYAYLGTKSSHWLLAKGRAKFFNKITGGVFMGAGVLLSTTSRT